MARMHRCSSRWKGGLAGPPERDHEGRYPCDKCERTFETFRALGVHGRDCDGGAWRCAWCACDAQHAQGRNPGPDGPRTLCSVCASRYRSGATGPPATTADGSFFCERCDRLFESLAALSTHKRHCAA